MGPDSGWDFSKKENPHISAGVSNQNNDVLNTKQNTNQKPNDEVRKGEPKKPPSYFVHFLFKFLTKDFLVKLVQPSFKLIC